MKLLAGPGTEQTGACWMSALHYYTRKDRSWTDEAPWACVSPIVRHLGISLNDRAPDVEREALIGPHLFAPLGTNTGPEDERTRAFLCADRAVRVFAPMALRARGRAAEAAILEALPPIVGRASALVGEAVAHRAATTSSVSTAAACASAAAAAYAAAAYAAAAYAAASSVSTAAACAANAAACAASTAAASAAASAASTAAASAADGGQSARRALLDLILACCAVGQKVEPEATCSRGDVERMLCARD